MEADRERDKRMDVWIETEKIAILKKMLPFCLQPY